MSEKFSNLPGLHLRPGSSRLRRRLFACFCLGCVYSACLLLADAYLWAGCLLLLIYALLLWPLRREPMALAAIVWLEGQWYIEVSGELRPVEISTRSVCHPWLIYLVWRELPLGGKGCQWLFADSAPRDQLRGLRVRLRLQG